MNTCGRNQNLLKWYINQHDILYNQIRFKISFNQIRSITNLDSFRIIIHHLILYFKVLFLELKAIVLMLIVLASVGMMKAYADDGYSFGVRLIPQKLIENSEGTLQVYALHNGHISPQKIQNMIYSSSDSSVLQIIGVENSNDGFTTNIKLITSNHGTANIELGAPGFSSSQVPVTVYGNSNYPTKLLVQSTPSTFSVNGPHEGYFTVELANNDGTPAITDNDILISLTTSDNKVITLTAPQIIVKAGTYYGIGKFEVKEPGTAQIFASGESLQSADSTVTVIQNGSPHIQMFVYPQVINSYQASIGYVITQLTDSSGNLMPAKEDITIPVNVLDPPSNETNSSPILHDVTAYNPIVIKKGSYWGYTNLAVRAGANATYTVTASVPSGYVNPGPGQVTTATGKFYDDKSAVLSILPILATGNDELIGVVQLQDQSGNPVIASHDLQVEIDSSDPDTISVDNAIMNKGTGVALVFAKVGTNIPPLLPGISSTMIACPTSTSTTSTSTTTSTTSTSGCSTITGSTAPGITLTTTPQPLVGTSGVTGAVSLHVVTYNEQTVYPTMFLLNSNSLNLVAQSLIPNILGNSNFPVATYLKDSSGAMTYFSDDSDLNILANDYFSIPQTTIHKGDTAVVSEADSLKDGSTSLTFIAGNYQTSLNLQTSSTSASQVALNCSNPIFLNMPNTMTVQIFDSKSNPVFAQKDITLKLVSTNNQILTLPDNVTISKGQYYTTFDVTPNSIGTVQASIIADDLPLSTYKISVGSLSPTLKIIAPKSVLPGDTFVASVIAKNHGDPLNNMNIQWKVNGASIQSSDSVTNQNGTANIVLVPNSGSSINLDVNATGLGYIPAPISKIITINETGSSLPVPNRNSSSVNGSSVNGSSGINPNMSSSVGIQSILKLFKVNGIDTLPILVLGTIAAGGVLVKKNSILSRKTQSNTGIKSR